MVVVAVEEPQYGLRNDQPIVHPICPLSSLISLILLNATCFDTLLQLPFHVSLVELHVPLAGKQSLLNVHTLHLGMSRCCPDMYLRPLLQQIGGLGRRRIYNVIEVHLVQADFGFVSFEELLADVGKVELGVRELPLTVWFGFDFRPKYATENLVAEADSGESYVGPVRPDV